MVGDRYHSLGCNLGLIAAKKLKFGTDKIIFTHEVKSEVLIIAMATWMTKKKPKTSQVFPINLHSFISNPYLFKKNLEQYYYKQTAIEFFKKIAFMTGKLIVSQNMFFSKCILRLLVTEVQYE